jgi:molybdopterin-guanine dinucleotide biosynthesis protein A
VIFGLVLAGGRSSRFGREKALADLDGRPFIAHVVTALAAGCEQVAINARVDSLAAGFAGAHALPCLSDAPSDPDGPLAGIKAGLIWAKAGGATFLATAPCDTPFLPADMVKVLAGETGGRPAVARTLGGLQPLCALWPISALAAVTAALSGGDHPAIKHVLEQLKAELVDFDEADLFDNLNTPKDYQTALHRAGRTRP